MVNFKSIGSKIVAKMMQKIASNDSASKKVIEQITGDIRNNFNKVGCDNCCIFIGSKKYKDYAEKTGGNVFEINKNDLLKIQGIPDGMLTFETFSKLFSGENSGGNFCVVLHVDSENDLAMSIYSYTDLNEEIETDLIVSKKLTDFIGDAIKSMSEQENDVPGAVMGAMENIIPAQLPDNE